MHPKLFTVNLPAFELLGHSWGGPTTLHTYGFLLAIAFLAGLFVVSSQARRAGMDATRITDMAVWLLIAGLVGAKVLLVAVDWRFYLRNTRELWSIFQSGGVFYGGLLGGILVAAFYVWRYKLPGWATADVLAPGVVIGQAIGRLGCFAAGCCFGKPATVPWAVTFTDVYAARQVGTPMDTALHPTQIYESLACFVIFFFLLWLAPRKSFHGQVALSYAVLYSSFRFAVEFFRGDPDRGSVFGGLLSTSQLIAIVLVLCAALVFPYVRRTQKIVATPAAA
jgi:phosphatidylglycerol---prolipoprotein diacylglyceryl transferase